MNKVIVRLAAFTDTENHGDRQRRQPHQEQFEAGGAKDEIEDGKHKEDRQDLGNLVSEDQELFFQALVY